MPLFGNKFTPKKPPPRKSSASAGSVQQLDQLVGDDRVVKLKLGEQEQVFRDGEWAPGKYTLQKHDSNANCCHAHRTPPWSCFVH